MSLLDKSYYLVGGTAALPLAMLETPVTEAYNSLNNAWRGGQFAGRYNATGDIHDLGSAVYNGSTALLGLAGPASMVPVRSMAGFVGSDSRLVMSSQRGSVGLDINVGANATANAKTYGVTFFGDDILPFYGPSKATVGNPNGAPSFFMPLEDSALVKNAHDAATYTGMAPSAQKAYLTGGNINGFSFPINDLAVTRPTAIDAGGWPHYLEGGNTAVKLEGPNAGYMVTPVREFVTPGNSPVPSGSVLFQVGPNGEWIPLRRW